MCRLCCNKKYIGKRCLLPKLGPVKPFVRPQVKKARKPRVMDSIEGLDEPMIPPSKIPEGMFQAWDSNRRCYKIVSEPSQGFWKKRYEVSLRDS